MGRNTRPEPCPASSLGGAQVVNLMHLTNPKHPRTIRTFKTATSILPDDPRKPVS